jgi:hypothetical protein
MIGILSVFAQLERGTRVFVVISLGTVTPAVLAGVFVSVQRFCIWF